MHNSSNNELEKSSFQLGELISVLMYNRYKVINDCLAAPILRAISVSINSKVITSYVLCQKKIVIEHTAL